MIHFEIPKNQSSIIKVIGVGGGGGNAVNYMYSLGIEEVDFIVCNTDSQALQKSEVPNKIQLGPHLTQGLGAGANPDIGRQAGEESIEEISRILEVNTKMAFVTAGMGGGTGTGAAPIIASVCRSLGILTVGIVTTPFTYEGSRRMRQAHAGISEMKNHVDTILIISNDKLRQQYGDLPFSQAFAKADNVLATAAKCITDLITGSGSVNLDFNDVQTVMKNGGVAILGSAYANGENRATQAVEEALSSPLLNDSEIKGAKWILLNITSAAGEHEHTLDELEIIQAYVQKEAGNNCDIILGMGHDDNLGENIAVTVIATGFQHNEIITVPEEEVNDEPEKVILTLDTDSNNPEEKKEKEVPQPEVDAMAPKLVLSEQQAPKPEPKDQNNVFELNIEPATTPKEAVTHNHSDLFAGSNAQAQPQQSRVQQNNQSNLISEREAEEKRRFEEQKKALEDRAAQLRKMSFNMNADMNDVENIPAYQRRNADVVEEAAKSNNENSSLSGLSVDDKSHMTFNSKNKYLDGDKPD